METPSTQNSQNTQSNVFSAVSAVSAFIVLGMLCSSAFAAGRPITVTDLLSLQRISDVQVSPDGARVLYTVAVPEIQANRSARHIWMVSVATAEARAITTTGHDGSARWSPDGRSVAFVSDRGGSPQLY